MMELRVYSWIIVFLLSTYVATSKELTCEDFHCRNNECSESGECLQGCMDGFIVDDEGHCVEGCTGNCSICDNGICRDCRSGYFGLLCSQLCSGCQNGSCEKYDGKCVNGCREGFKNPPFCDVTDAAYNKKQMDDEEERVRGFFIWIAGTIILSIIFAIIIMIVAVVLQRSRTPDEPSAERLYREGNDVTEIV
ncbi:uncharacterized protein LOC132736219 [Ruditapes philippinarum]|uniref:uncharacterized protein LOC132736219 n=1 Tax=Ruditapes philippinarum TaxID=129788 RepID=UPI00295B0C59|nr:uncharacterized protein LOC132736219 [Ruditapes philippinarum]